MPVYIGQEKRVNKKLMIQKRYIIGLCGGSCSGKSRFAEDIAKFIALDRVNILSEDDYYLDKFENPEAVNFDSPEVREHSLFLEHLRLHLENKAIPSPVYDFTTHTRTQDIRIIEPKSILIIEGTHIFANPEIRNLLDFKIYIEVNEEKRLKRRIKRDKVQRGRTKQSVLKQWQDSVVDGHKEFTEAFKGFADLIIENNGNYAKSLRQLIKAFRLNNVIK